MRRGSETRRAAEREWKRQRRNARERATRAARRDAVAERERERRDALKRQMIAYLGGACMRCRRTLEDFGHPAAFDFHHRDWRTKAFNFAGNYKRAWAVLRAELDKCDLLCACCHRITEALATSDRRRGRPPRGSRPTEVATPPATEPMPARATNRGAERARQFDLLDGLQDRAA